MLNLSACIVFAHSLSLSLSLNGALILCYLRALLLCYLMLPDEQAETIQLALNLFNHCQGLIRVSIRISNPSGRRQ